MQVVVSSKSFSSLSKNRGVAQLASVLAWGASGRQFESDHSDKIKSKTSVNLYFTEIFYYQLENLVEKQKLKSV